MDPRISLLKEFSRGFQPGTAKIETEQFGFPFLHQLLSDGARLDYGELTPVRLLHKYKLSGLSAARLDALLRMHVHKECNLCRYFAAGANDAFCFNLDNNHKTDATRPIPEMDLALRGLRGCLLEAGLEPFIVASGRGFHVWCRLEVPVENDRLYRFMLGAAARALRALQTAGYDRHRIKFNFYPDVHVHEVVSLRLFGSDHSKNRVFSRVYTPDGLLDEAASWESFECFVRRQTASTAQFTAAARALAALD